MGLDPGKVNFAFSLYSSSGLELTGVMEGAEEVEELRSFRIRFVRKLKRYRPDAVFIERYHVRLGNSVIKNMELVNLMIGIVYDKSMSLGIPCHLITASTHKNWALKNLEVSKKEIKERGKKRSVIDLESYHEWGHLETEHEIDASNLAKYGYEKFMEEISNDN